MVILGEILSIDTKIWFSYISIKTNSSQNQQAEIFYNIHRKKPFFGELVMFMTRSPIIVAVLKKIMQLKISEINWFNQSGRC